MSINYSKTFLSTLKDLSRLSSKVVINKADGSLKVCQITEDKSINYVVTAPETHFEFPSSELAFFNFPDFYAFMELFVNPSLEISNNKIIISDGTSKTEYISSNVLSCSVGTDVKWNNPSVRFELSQKELETLVRASGLLISSDNVKKARIHGNGENCTIELVNVNINPKQKGYDKTFSREFKVTQLSENCGEYDFIINRNLFTDSPKKNYVFEINQKGFVRASYKEDEVEVKIYASFLNSNERG